MTRLSDLLETRSSLKAEASKILDAAGDAAPDDNAQKRLDQIFAESDALEKRVANQAKIDEMDRQSSGRNLTDRASQDFKRECRSYRLCRAIAAQVPELARSVDAGREIEISQELARRSGKTADGLLAPTEVFEERVVTSTAPVGGPGGNVIPTEHLGDQYIDRLRAQLVTQRLGATVLSGLMGDVDIPKLKTSAARGWVAENGAISASDHAFERVQMKPKHVGVLTGFSRNMLQQASPDIEQLVRQDFAALLGEGIDAAALKGGGANEPTGILATSGVTDIDMGGGATWALILDMIASVEGADALIGALGFAANPYVIGRLRTITKVSGDAGAGFIADAPNSLAGYPLVSSSLLAGDSGGTSVAGEIIFGNWNDLLIGYWSAFDLLVNPYEGDSFSKGNVLVRGMATCDVAMRHTESFAFSDNVSLD